MPNMSKQYQLMLGTFIDNEFVWHDVDSYEDLETAYAEFKKYVNSQLKYTDEELIKVWNTGRLDVELRRGNRLLNWVGIYAREVDRLSKEDEEEADKENPEKQEAKDSAPKGRPARRICPRCYQELESRGECEGKWDHIYVDDTDPVESLCDMCGESGYDELYVRGKVKVGDVVLFTPEQRKKVLELAEEGNYNLTQLAIHAGVSKPQARLILKNKDNPDAFDYGYHPSDEEIKEIKELARHGYSPAKIARTLGGGATVPAVKKILESEKK